MYHDKFKLNALASVLSLINISIFEGQQIKGFYSGVFNLISNINGGLGIWSGYNSTYYKVPIVKDTVIKEKYEPELFEIF